MLWKKPSPSLEKAMATHSSTFAWKIPWTEEPGRLQSMGSLRVRHDWATSLSLFLSCIGEGNGSPLQSCLENPRNEGAWWAAVYGVAQSRTRLKRLSSSSILIYCKGSARPGSSINTFHDFLESPQENSLSFVSHNKVDQTSIEVYPFTLWMSVHTCIPFVAWSTLYRLYSRHQSWRSCLAHEYVSMISWMNACSSLLFSSLHIFIYFCLSHHNSVCPTIAAGLGKLQS